jgi:protein-S-isoprenylcysteine O-methyltransferase Ste14
MPPRLSHIPVMDDRYVGITIGILWLAWLLYWWFSARDVKPTRTTETGREQLAYRIPLVLGILCLSAPGLMPPVLHRRFVPPGTPAQVAGLVLLAAGLGFTVWARRHLGRNWSASVVVKEDHALIQSGPYRRVRHPIYTGMLFGFLGTTVAVGEWRGLVGFVLVFVSFLLKSRREEARMAETFPEYAEYRHHTAALIPGLY